MSQIITIYRVICAKAYLMSETGDGLSLEPWGHNTDTYEGWDDGGKLYILPDGFEVASDGTAKHIYRVDRDQPEILITTHDGLPAIMTDYLTGVPHVIIFERAPEVQA